RGHRRQAPPVALRAGPAGVVVAENQGASRAGGGRRAPGRGRRGTRARAPGGGNAKEPGAVVVGVYDDGRLRFSGKVGSGFDGRARKELRGLLDALETDSPPLAPPPAADYRGRWGGDLAGVRWTRPELIIRAEIGGWTRDGHVRQTAFQVRERRREPRATARERAAY